MEHSSSQTILRRTSEEVCWRLLTPPDVDAVAHRVSRKLRQEIESEALSLVEEAGGRAELGRIGVRAKNVLRRPWFALGLAVRCEVQAMAKLRVRWNGAGETNGDGRRARRPCPPAD